MSKKLDWAGGGQSKLKGKAKEKRGRWWEGTGICEAGKEERGVALESSRGQEGGR